MPRFATVHGEDLDDHDSRWCRELTGRELSSPQAYEFGNRQGGFYAEFATAHAEHVGRVPKGLNLRDAGAVATTGLTALQGIDALELRAGQTVLIFGASGAVGTMRFNSPFNE